MEEIYTFAGNPLDRVSQRRQDAGWIASLLDDPETRLLPLRELKPLVRDSSAAELDWQPVAPWRGAIDAGATLILLGIGDETGSFRARCQRGAGAGRSGDRDRRCPRPGRLDPRRRGRNSRRSALAARLARAPWLLRAMRHGERNRLCRMGAALPELPGPSLSASRPGCDHARGQGRALPARSRAAAGRDPFLLSRRIHGAR